MERPVGQPEDPCIGRKNRDKGRRQASLNGTRARRAGLYLPEVDDLLEEGLAGGTKPLGRIRQSASKDRRQTQNYQEKGK